MERKGLALRFFAWAAALIALIVAAALAFRVLGWPSAVTLGDDGRPVSEYTRVIPQVKSGTDTDGDGVDDQTELLNGALAYLDTRPAYKSAYYSGGRPDDGQGVCTDVVDQAMLAAGFDLQQLIDADYAASPESYPGISSPDPAIDFRRVVNQNVWFARHATSRTTDLSKIEEWQGGDIVVFNEHIGIVSDRRMADGTPYLIHHDRRGQKYYENKGLIERDDIIAHYRLP